MTAFVTAADVRGYLVIDGTTGRYSDGAIGSNIRAASEFLERATHRVFADTTATKVFTTQGRTAITIPGLRSASSVTLQSTVLTADQSYYLIPDAQQSGLYTSIQFRGFSSRTAASYLSNPEWFDRDLDVMWAKGWDWTYSLPNDLSITGSWGYTDASLPEAVRHAAKVLAGWYTKRPDSVLANVSITPDGNVLNYGDLPPEVGDFIANWRLTADQVVSVG